MNNNKHKKVNTTIMSKIFTGILLLFFISTNLNAQFSNKKIKGNGNITTTDRSVSNFDKIGIAGSFDVILNKGNEGDISIQADENLMEYIITEVKNGQLKIKPKKGYQLKSTKTMQITIGFNDLEEVSLAGSGDVTASDAINASDLKLSLAGSGDMNLKVSTKHLTSKIAGSGNISLNGSTDEFSCSIAGSGNLNGYELKATVAKAKIAGSGNIKVNAVSEIHASIAGSGNVYYTGNPDVEKSNSVGSGSLKKKN
jgi:hypothetical protein